MNTPPECRAVDERLLACAAGELAAHEALAIRAHLAACDHCGAALAELQQTRALAAAQQLTSPALDRYPEFLRRLTTQTALSHANVTTMTEPLTPALASHAERETHGLAAALPLFGNRLLVRSGFGRGFDLRLVSRQDGELFRLSAQSLARVAATVAGAGALAAAIGAAVFLLFFARDKQTLAPALTTQNNPAPAAPTASQPAWVQTINGPAWSLALWQHAGQVRAGVYPNADATRVTPLQLDQPLTQQPADLRQVDCAATTDGESFVLVRATQQTLYAWHIEPSRTQASAPQDLGLHGAQPALAWTGDRYLMAWIDTATPEPKIKLRELDRTGARLSSAAEIAIADTEHNAKVGTPAIFAHDGNALLVYHRQGGTLFGKLWNARAGLRPGEFSIGPPPRILINRPFIAAVADGYVLCWGETEAHRARLHFARLNEKGETIKHAVLAERVVALTSFDCRLNNASLRVVWTEATNAGPQFFTQSFDLDGAPVAAAQPILPGSEMASSASFADATTDGVWWLTETELRREPLAQAIDRAASHSADAHR